MPRMKYSGVEWIGDIPIDWKVNRLRYNCTFKTGGTPPQVYVGIIAVVIGANMIQMMFFRKKKTKFIK